MLVWPRSGVNELSNESLCCAQAYAATVDAALRRRVNRRRGERIWFRIFSYSPTRPFIPPLLFLDLPPALT